MKTPLQKVIERLKDLHDQNDGHSAYQQAVADCCQICQQYLEYEHEVFTKNRTEQ
jgi:hypothetical protein